jgi:hypothetical protein
MPTTAELADAHEAMALAADLRTLDELLAYACAAEALQVRRLVAQVAVEAIVNHPHDGWEASTMATVLAEARAAGVATIYTAELAELVNQ